MLKTAFVQSVATLMELATSHKETSQVCAQFIGEIVVVHFISNDTAQRIQLSVHELYDSVSLWDMVEQAVLSARVGF